jgi:hypothetical protein
MLIKSGILAIYVGESKEEPYQDGENEHPSGSQHELGSLPVFPLMKVAHDGAVYHQKCSYSELKHFGYFRAFLIPRLTITECFKDESQHLLRD